MKESINTSSDKKDWLTSLKNDLNFQDRFVDSTMKANEFNHIGNELHNEDFAQSEIINEAKIIVEKLASTCHTSKDMKNKVEKLYQILMTKGVETTADEIKKATYSYILSRLK